jgi:hypothetical protein
MGESPELVAAMQLMDKAKSQGFSFTRIGSGEDAPLHGVRVGVCVDNIYIDGLSDGCSAMRIWFALGEEAEVAARVEGDALTVLGRGRHRLGKEST